LFEVAQGSHRDLWVLVGGLMVQAHAMLAGVTPTRATTDVDLMLDFLTRDASTQTVVADLPTGRSGARTRSASSASRRPRNRALCDGRHRRCRHRHRRGSSVTRSSAIEPSSAVTSTGRGAQLGWRMRANSVLPVLKELPNGSYLSEVYPDSGSRRRRAGGSAPQ
jgi:hypothetical protein